MRVAPIWLLNKSKELRKEQIPWEAKLWYHLKGKRFAGLKFKRQITIDNHIVDFCRRRKMLIIELDGSQHNESGFKQPDQARQKHLENKGYKVLRFWNNQLDENMDSVLDKIYFELINLSPSLSPSQERGVLKGKSK